MGAVVGVVPYLNAEPLAAALEDASLFPGVQVRAVVPSLLIEELLADRVDVALVSTAAVLPHPQLRILPGMCVASCGPVESIQLYQRAPFDQVRTVALDASSRSAHTLTRLLYAARYGQRPEFITRPPDLRAMLSEVEAALLIGNPCLQANVLLEGGGWDGPAVRSLDLGAEWTEFTGLPFVWAVWAAKADRPLGELTEMLQRSLAWGLERRQELADRGAAELSIGQELARRYVGEIIRYQMGDAELGGARRFAELCREHQVLLDTAEVRLFE